MTEKRLKEYCKAEFANIEKVLLEIVKLKHTKRNSFNSIELAALGAFLHNFYNGIENTLKRVILHEGIKISAGPNWHKDLLKTSQQHKIINKPLMSQLIPYLTFRHFFVHGYGFTLVWEKMKNLVDNIEPVYKKFHSAITNYLDKS